MAKYSNFSDDSQGVGLLNLDCQVAVRRVGALEGEPHAFYGPLQKVNFNFDSGIVEGHSSVATSVTTIPPYKLPSGLYQVTLIFYVNALGNPPQRLMFARPTTVIQVR